MTVRISTLRASAELEVGPYVAAAERKARADQKMVDSGQKAAAGAEATDRKITASSRGLDRWWGTVEKSYGSQLRFAQGQDRLNRALETGRIDVAEHTRRMGILEQQFGATARAVNQNAAAVGAAQGGFRNFGQGIQNASFQVADLATQLAGGTSATVALAQQLPQLLGGFGILGAAAGAAVAVLGALAPPLLKSGDASKEAATAADVYRDALDSLKEQQTETLELQQKLNDAWRGGFVQPFVDEVARLKAEVAAAQKVVGGLDAARPQDAMGSPITGAQARAYANLAEARTNLATAEDKLREAEAARNANIEAAIALDQKYLAQEAALLDQLKAGAIGRAEYEAREQALTKAREQGLEIGGALHRQYLDLYRAEGQLAASKDAVTQAMERTAEAAKDEAEAMAEVSEEVQRLVELRDATIRGMEVENQALALQAAGRSEEADWLRQEVRLREQLGPMYAAEESRLRALWEQRRALNNEIKDQADAYREADRAAKRHADEMARDACEFPAEVLEEPALAGMVKEALQ